MRLLIFFFFKQKTAYEMRISDWSSDVCSSDLLAQATSAPAVDRAHRHRQELPRLCAGEGSDRRQAIGPIPALAAIGRGADRKSVVEGKSVSVRVVLGGRRIIKKKQTNRQTARRQ